MISTAEAKSSGSIFLPCSSPPPTFPPPHSSELGVLSSLQLAHQSDLKMLRNKTYNFNFPKLNLVFAPIVSLGEKRKLQKLTVPKIHFGFGEMVLQAKAHATA